MNDAENSGAGHLFASARRLAGTVASMAYNRLELFLVELQEERYRLVRILLLAGVLMVFALMTILFFSFAIVILFWDTNRMAALLGLGVFYLAGMLVAWVKLQSQLKNGTAFTATMDELKKDKQWLEKGK